jgi:hypothetical protein
VRSPRLACNPSIERNERSNGTNKRNDGAGGYLPFGLVCVCVCVSRPASQLAWASSPPVLYRFVIRLYTAHIKKHSVVSFGGLEDSRTGRRLRCQLELEAGSTGQSWDCKWDLWPFRNLLPSLHSALLCPCAISTSVKGGFDSELSKNLILTVFLRCFALAPFRRQSRESSIISSACHYSQD